MLEIKRARRYGLKKSIRVRASSSVVEQGTFNPRVVGSIPTWLTSRKDERCGYAPPSSRGPGHRPFKAAARVRIPLGARSGRPARSSAGARAISSGVERLPYKEEVAGSNPASPTLKSSDLQDNPVKYERARRKPRLFDDYLTTARSG